MPDRIKTDQLLKDELRVFVVPVDIFDVPDLTIYEQMAYIVLRSHCSARDATAFPSYATLAKEARMSRRQAIRAIDELLARGLLEKQQQFRLSKNGVIQNTSNFYTVKTPQPSPQDNDTQRKVVTDSHQGSDQQSPGVVTVSHQGSDCQSPKQNHLTDPFEQIHKNNNKDVVVEQIESYLKVPVTSIKTQLIEWTDTYGVLYLTEKAQYIGQNPKAWKNIVGAFRMAVLDNWKNEVATAGERDERYAEFYRLFPNT